VIAVMLMSVALIAGLSVLAYTLAVYALPFMLGVEAARFAYATGSCLIGAGLVGLGRRGRSLWPAGVRLRVPAFAQPAPDRGGGLRRARRHGGLRPCPRRHARGRAVRSLAADFLHHRWRVRRRVGTVTTSAAYEPAAYIGPGERDARTKSARADTELFGKVTASYPKAGMTVANRWYSVRLDSNPCWRSPSVA